MEILVSLVFLGVLLIHTLLLADYESVVKLSDGFNGADLRNVCTEAGMANLVSYLL